ncbi:hypothetical protein DPMN_021496 [Dreissena polymorpha]|uniref:Uncharacterized protein n=1 Tax=Dreissena polymorpha TaxID=45954 RepID=A0A9D4NM95_DREPO|nr:hypothetical protein DPMN_021496 [Dreissena polymorpha]
MLRLWDRLVKMPDERLTKKVFNWDFSHNKSWNSDIKDIIDSLNPQNLFQSRSMGNISLHCLLSRATKHYEKIEQMDTGHRNTAETQNISVNKTSLCVR